MTERTVSSEFIERWNIFYGEKVTEDILKQLNQTDPRIIAPNTLYTSRSALKESLEKQGFKISFESNFNALFLDFEPFNVVSTTEYLSGLFSIQSLTSLLPPMILKPSPGSVVADLAASPGIKTCLLAVAMKNKGTILAVEKAKKRIPALKANIARMGIYNTIILNGDSRSFPELNIEVDHILLDAPCSGTGLKLKKDKRLKTRVLHDTYRHAEIQRDLLDAAWEQLKVNGTLVYSTCSLEPEEGEVQISDFLSRHEKNVEILPIINKYGVSGDKTLWKENLHPQVRKTKRIFPSQGMDGFFTALLKKVESD